MYHSSVQYHILLFFRIGDHSQTFVNNEVRRKSVSNTKNKTERYYCDEFIVNGELFVISFMFLVNLVTKV